MGSTKLLCCKKQNRSLHVHTHANHHKHCKYTHLLFGHVLHYNRPDQTDLCFTENVQVHVHCVRVGGQCELYHSPLPQPMHMTGLTKCLISLLWSKFSEHINESKDHEINSMGEKAHSNVHALPHIKHLLDHRQHRRISAEAGQLCSCHIHWPPPKQPSGPS